MDNKNLPVERQMLAIFKYWDVLHKNMKGQNQSKRITLSCMRIV